VSRTLILSDLHLSDRSNYTPDHNDEVCEALARVLYEHQPDHVIVAGDVFHDKTHLTPKVLQVVNKLKKVLNGVDVTVVKGNHDGVGTSVQDLLVVFESERQWAIRREPVVLAHRIALCPYGCEMSVDTDQVDLLVGHGMPSFVKSMKASNEFSMHPNAYDDEWGTKPPCPSVWGHCHAFAFFPPDVVFLGVFLPRLRFDDSVGHYLIYDWNRETPLSVHKTDFPIKTKDLPTPKRNRAALPKPEQHDLTPEKQVEIAFAKIEYATDQVATELKLDPKVGRELLKEALSASRTP